MIRMDVDNNIAIGSYENSEIREFFFFFIFLGVVDRQIRWTLEFWKNFGMYNVVEIYRWITNIGKFLEIRVML